MPWADSSAPYLAAVPVAEPPPRRRRRWLVGGTIASAVVVLLILGVLATVSVAHSSNESFTLSNPGSLGEFTHSVTFPRSGVFQFSWATTNGGTLTFTVLDPLGATLYHVANAASGAASISVSSGTEYTFEILDWLGETVHVMGTLTYSAPML